MTRSLKLARACVLLLAVTPMCAQARDARTSEPAPVAQARAQQRTMHAVRVTQPITVDGRLDEPAWAEATPASDFRQQEPREGEPATEATEVRVLYDEKYLYVGVRASERDATRVNARELTRDANFQNDDKVEILLDTFHDRRNGFRFAINPLGTQQDALVTDEGRSINMSWDARWLSEAVRDGSGWTAEVAIPLSTLRFREGQPAWGVNFSRVLRGRSEESLWTAYQREFGLERVSQAGTLTGMGELRRRRLFEVKPYITAGARSGVEKPGAGGLESTFHGKAGLEVAKVGITPSLTLELTANPDFGQTEVDQQVVNLSRFSVFLPERRDFFLENAGYFFFGRESINQLFFSRRIGLTSEGAPVAIDAGAKLTGRAGAYSVGLMQVQTRGMGLIPRQHFTVARVKRDIFSRSYIGAIVTNRQGGERTSYNRGAGFDARLLLNNYWVVESFVMATATPGLRHDTGSGRIVTSYQTDRWRFAVLAEEIGRNFNPELGFVERRDNRQLYSEAAWSPRPKFIPFVRQFEFEAQTKHHIRRSTNQTETRQNELTVETQFANNAWLEFRPVEDVLDVLHAPFEIHKGVVIPAGAYRFNRVRVQYESSPSKRFIWRARQKWGDFYSGTRYEASAGFTYRPNAHLLVTVDDSFNRVKLPQGEFSTQLVSGRVNFNFSRKLLTSMLMQVNSRAELTAVNARLRYIYRPNSDFYVIYNQGTGRGLERPTRQLQLKLTYYYGD